MCDENLGRSWFDRRLPDPGGRRGDAGGELAALGADGEMGLEPGLVERLAVALQASLLLRHAPATVADAFRSRAGAYGTLPSGGDYRSIIERHRPISVLTTA